MSKVRIAVVGLGKMGLSHLAIIRSHPNVELVAVCDSATYVLDTLSKYTGLKVYEDYGELLKRESLDALLIATPSKAHGSMVRAALDRNLHVFCEKPFSLNPEEGRDLADLAEQKGVVTQVGYHFRFVGAFQEVKRLLEQSVIGEIHHVRVEAYGPVVLRTKPATWRTRSQEGGGCLYDYACHALDLLNYLVGAPDGVSGAVLRRIFSTDTDDEVYASLTYKSGLSAQLAANWSDDSFRKMTTRVTLWGKNGRIYADRQEVQVFLRDAVVGAPDLTKGWNVRYTTELTEEVWYYLRGEEYSEQIDHFVDHIMRSDSSTRCTFREAVLADDTVQMIVTNASAANETRSSDKAQAMLSRGATRRPWWQRF